MKILRMKNQDSRIVPMKKRIFLVGFILEMFFGTYNVYPLAVYMPLKENPFIVPHFKVLISS